MGPTELHLTIYVADGADPDRVIDGLNDVMLVMVDEFERCISATISHARVQVEP